MWTPAHWSSTYWAGSNWTPGSTGGLLLTVQNKAAAPGSTVELDPLGLGDTFTMKIENTGFATVLVSQISYTGEIQFLSGFESGEIQGGESVSTLVQIKPDAVSPFLGTINVTSDDLSNPNYLVHVTAELALTLGVCGDAGTVRGPLAAAGACKSHQLQDGCCLTVPN